jgi:hypothetical protein
MQHAHYESKRGNGHLRGHKPAGRVSSHGRKQVETCPYCGQRDEVIPILYGFPSHAGFMKAERGEVYLGGCEISPYLYYCKRDDREF